MHGNYLEDQRRQMLDEIATHAYFAAQHTDRAVFSASVMSAMSTVPRHEYVPVELQLYAYEDTPLPIGYDKTISQPFIVALMTDLLELEAEHRVLEIGTGLGYQAAILAELCNNVYSIEIVRELAVQARARLDRHGYSDRVTLEIGDGSRGWPEHAPYDRIIVTAAPDLVPPPLLNQLAPGGRMVVPAGLLESQKLLVVERPEIGATTIREVLAVRFSELESDEL
jgi:protein-L-isoaspartate(D-aspartate) O-methyltransferase